MTNYKDYYVYGHYDSTGTCRYVGKGRRRRAYVHAQRSKRWASIFGKTKPTVRFFAKDLTEHDAFKKEIELVRSFLAQGNDLANVSAGGMSSKGWDKRASKILSQMRAKERHWTWGKPRPQSTRDKIKATKQANPAKSIARPWLGKKRDPELMAKLTRAGQTKEARRKQAETRRGRKASAETRARQSAAAAKRPVRCISTGEVFDSAKKAGESIGSQGGKITECCQGKRLTVKGTRWEYCNVPIH